MVTSNDGDKGSNKGGSNYNNHRSSMDMDSNRGMGIGICSNRGTGMGNNMIQDRVASLTVNNTIPPPGDDRIVG